MVTEALIPSAAAASPAWVWASQTHSKAGVGKNLKDDPVPAPASPDCLFGEQSNSESWESLREVTPQRDFTGLVFLPSHKKHSDSSQFEAIDFYVPCQKNC